MLFREGGLVSSHLARVVLLSGPLFYYRVLCSDAPTNTAPMFFGLICYDAQMVQFWETTAPVGGLFLCFAAISIKVPLPRAASSFRRRRLRATLKLGSASSDSELMDVNTGQAIY